MNPIRHDDQWLIFDDRRPWIFYAAGGVLLGTALVAGNMHFRLAASTGVILGVLLAGASFAVALVAAKPHLQIVFDLTRKHVVVRRSWPGVVRDQVHAFQDVTTVKTERNVGRHSITYRASLLLADGRKVPLGNWDAGPEVAEQARFLASQVLALDETRDGQARKKAEAAERNRTLRGSMVGWLAIGGFVSLVILMALVGSIRGHMENQANIKAMRRAAQERQMQQDAARARMLREKQEQATPTR